MIEIYEYLIFSNLISNGLKKGNGNMEFGFSDRLTSTGGKCRRTGVCTYNITISSDRLNKLLPGNISDVHVNGITPKDRVDALLLIFEHELIHAVLSIFKDDLSGHDKLFKTIAKNLFGHVKSTHGIIDKKLDSPTQSIKNNFRVGDNVYFINKKNEKILGRIIKINPKRAKVNTITGVFAVPYNMLSFVGR